MDFISPEIRLTGDGSATLVCPQTGDTYHSVNGAVEESMHVFVRNGFLNCEKDEVRVLEAGFGSGLNAWLTARQAAATGRKAHYTGVELHPVKPECLRTSGFPDDPLFTALHTVGWGKEVPVSATFILHKIYGDLAETVFDVKFDVVYFDMFAPDTHPRLWSEQIFSSIAQAMDPAAVLVTYSAKGDVKRALRSSGFEVARLPGAPGKRHMLRAVRI